MTLYAVPLLAIEALMISGQTWMSTGSLWDLVYESKAAISARGPCRELYLEDIVSEEPSTLDS